MVKILVKMLTLRKVLKFGNNLRFKHTIDYDIIVVGAGLIGTTMALALAKAPQMAHKRILVLEKGEQENLAVHKEALSCRVCVLSVHSYEFLKSIHALEHFPRGRLKPIKWYHVWDGCTDAFTTLNHGTHPENIAYVFEYPLMQYAVYEELKNCHNVTVSYDSMLEKVYLPTHKNRYVEVYFR